MPKRLKPRPRAQKFRAKSCLGFPSQLEAAVYHMLLAWEKQGKIRNLKRQATVVVEDVDKDGNVKPDGERRRWKIDFGFEELDFDQSGPGWIPAYAEAKGFETNDYLRKVRMFKKNPPAKLYIFKGRYTDEGVEPVLHEIVVAAA